ncbi:hypothetical protein BKA14_002097 [Actinoplanes abujensis]|uniref:Uncharacterized protein n=1 Tax=Paractinoplanes abujensis TaxID=882441 RepID=A0A7W7CNR4_9ACTN|nr:hypothetical protein [Actinoplanes abujensis]
MTHRAAVASGRSRDTDHVRAQPAAPSTGPPERRPTPGTSPPDRTPAKRETPSAQDPPGARSPQRETAGPRLPGSRPPQRETAGPRLPGPRPPQRETAGPRPSQPWTRRARDHAAQAPPGADTAQRTPTQTRSEQTRPARAALPRPPCPKLGPPRARPGPPQPRPTTGSPASSSAPVGAVETGDRSRQPRPYRPSGDSPELSTMAGSPQARREDRCISVEWLVAGDPRWRAGHAPGRAMRQGGPQRACAGPRHHRSAPAGRSGPVSWRVRVRGGWLPVQASVGHLPESDQRGTGCRGP